MRSCKYLSGFAGGWGEKFCKREIVVFGGISGLLSVFFVC